MFCFVWVYLFIKAFSLSSKSVFVTKFACSNLATKFSAVGLLNSGVVMYLSWLWSGILFSIAVRAVLVAKLVMLGISPLISFILSLRVVLVVKLVISGILS